jgi:Ala-tRNA(Pro) deacylase
MPVRKLKEYLNEQGVKYVCISHSPAYTAQEVAASAHVPGREMAKTVMVLVDGKPSMAVLPAGHRVDFDLLRQSTGARTVELAHEDDFRDLFPNCELGAMPPFGNLYGVDVYASLDLAEQRDIAFNACSHSEVMRLPFRDYARLVRPKVVRLSSD